MASSAARRSSRGMAGTSSCTPSRSRASSPATTSPSRCESTARASRRPTASGRLRGRSPGWRPAATTTRPSPKAPPSTWARSSPSAAPTATASSGAPRCATSMAATSLSTSRSLRASASGTVSLSGCRSSGGSRRHAMSHSTRPVRPSPHRRGPPRSGARASTASFSGPAPRRAWSPWPRCRSSWPPARTPTRGTSPAMRR
mmetsp:Transcript_43139/g.134151  ORF Transcript_43139/g.134151 Transcript_43139/m.134151 type:complete len:201 (+) Transcript_43139:1009-1611(+)